MLRAAELFEQELLARGLPDGEFVAELLSALQAEAAERGVELPPPSPEATGWCPVRRWAA